MDRELRLYGLTEATWRPLTHIKQLGNGIRQKDLAITLGIEGASLVALLSNLEMQGLIDRRVSDVDKRAYEIHMTQEGHTLCDWIGNVSARAHEAMFQDITERDLQVLKRVVGRMERSLDALIAAPPVTSSRATERHLERQLKERQSTTGASRSRARQRPGLETSN